MDGEEDCASGEGEVRKQEASFGQYSFRGVSERAEDVVVEKIESEDLTSIKYCSIREVLSILETVALAGEETFESRLLDSGCGESNVL